MTIQEYKAITKKEITDKDYYEIVEPMYSASPLDKYEFCKTINAKYFNDRYNEMKGYEFYVDFRAALLKKNIRYSVRANNIDELKENAQRVVKNEDVFCVTIYKNDVEVETVYG